jgi:putative thioredoxin
MSSEVAGVHDVDEADFATQVLERSRELPVVVDFWAEWCGPCRQLTPALERAATARAGQVELAKVDVDRNQGLAQRFGVQGIPAVKAFRDGTVASEFTGAVSQADALVEGGDEESLRRALELDPRHKEARVALARLLLRRGDAADALDQVREITAANFLADGLAARAELTLDDADFLPDAFAAWDDGDHAAALERLQETFAAEADPSRRDLIRRVMVGIFTELGPEAELAREHRRRLSTALY